jgi:hypothetical protein
MSSTFSYTNQYLQELTLSAFDWHFADNSEQKESSRRSVVFGKSFSQFGYVADQHCCLSLTKQRCNQSLHAGLGVEKSSP